MYGLTRGTVTLLGVGAAGLLIWIATQVNDHSTGGYWAVYGLIAAAGLTMALSQLLGGWTKWGWPRLTVNVFLLAFVPIAIVSLWIVLAAEPGHGWFHRHVLSWSGDIHIRGLVNDLQQYVAVFAFGIGLVFGFSFDTTGPRRRAAPVDREAVVDRRAADEPLTAERDAAATGTPTATAGPHDREPVGRTTQTTDRN